MLRDLNLGSGLVFAIVELSIESSASVLSYISNPFYLDNSLN